MKITASINRIITKPDSPVKAFASVTLDGVFAVHGLRRATPASEMPPYALRASGGRGFLVAACAVGT